LFCKIECEEYSKLVKKAFQVASLSLTSDVQSVNVNKCDYASTGLIVGGEDARLNEFPHMAASKNHLLTQFECQI
jgi:hypothetical protein